MNDNAAHSCAVILSELYSYTSAVKLLIIIQDIHRQPIAAAKDVNRDYIQAALQSVYALPCVRKPRVPGRWLWCIRK
jgi:hypothetical protein